MIVSQHERSYWNILLFQIKCSESKDVFLVTKCKSTGVSKPCVVEVLGSNIPREEVHSR